MYYNILDAGKNIDSYWKYINDQPWIHLKESLEEISSSWTFEDDYWSSEETAGWKEHQKK